MSASLRLLVVDTDQFGAAAADAVLRRLPAHRPRLGVATGDTPIPLYRELARRHECGQIDLHTALLIALDEYVGLGPDDPDSYATYVRTRVAAPLGIGTENIVIADGLAPDPDTEAANLDARIEALGGVDVQIAGIGSNGHLAFNEPGSAWESGTRVVHLSERTRQDNARFFGTVADVPHRAITQGLGTISRARSIVVLAAGTAKSAALTAAVSGPIDPHVPASMLQRHPAVTVIADRAAAAGLSPRGEHR
ncbi:glucosamine-6-phosphate deaminase [Mycobacterium hackensackense]|uniref:glucosamine-6-phosphate deaminase n=1 Tax=Mycobacterium hackensackense TaxID=228909 RepID=UPI0022658E93|nr:glucosamine-6-phosphate deaminase [Mycobacterium hackensackense]MCV7251565.1 glucosamine-6-phosphate deaminase [Mycobacterium hackensackense]